MTFEIDLRHGLLCLCHYAGRDVHQPYKVAHELLFCECVVHQQWYRGIHQTLCDCLALRGGTECADSVWFWDSGLTGCVVNLAGILDRVFGERYGALRSSEH